ncbi:MAG: helix-turn-helix domain-containing protein [Flavobacterium sp.]|uniref:helix-turn-helix domain-containing protein n=1 Tax=Flavobacterium sp. TaxID=239 RepID=UPI003267ACCF
MLSQSNHTLVNPQNGNLAFKIFSFDNDNCFDHIQRNNYFSLIWIKEGQGKIKADFSEYDFIENTLFAFAPYQPFMFMDNPNIKGVAIYFHPEFFCIHKHQDEIACNGILYNNIYQPPYVIIDEDSSATFTMITDQIKNEIEKPALAQYELLVSFLKIFLITATRLKVIQQTQIEDKLTTSKEPFILQNLKNYIESHFKNKHSASDYANLLNMTPKALGKITKTHFNKTLTDLIAERIVIEAKRELYLTNKSVKEIAYELGYDDEHYFSRFFKNNAEVSPQMYRETVGFARVMS